MDFADERFVRIFVRDSKTWLRWGWEGQAVFVLVMRKFDQCGRIDDVDDPAEDVALLTGLPVEVVRVGLPRILGSKTFVHTGRSLECPNFIDGQTASRSDSARCREYRARLKSRLAVRQSTDTNRVAPDTECVAANTQRDAPTRADPRPTSLDTQTRIPSHPIPNQIPLKPPQGGQHAGTVPKEEPSVGKRGSKPRAKREPKAETPLPADFAPTDAHRAFAAERGIDLSAQLFAFKAHYAGRTASSWNGRLATWLTKTEPPRQAQRSNGFNAAQSQQRRVMTVAEARRQRELDEGSAP